MRKKVLLMGRSGSGKTSMRSIIFANYIARDTRRLGATIDVEHSHVRFLGNLVLSLWDCGGQEAFMESYFQSQRDTIFRNVEVLIYVFDVDSKENEKDLEYFKRCLDYLYVHSRDAKVFCLVHKMDLTKEEARDAVLAERTNVIRSASQPKFTPECFATSIWDETLFKAWSRIVYLLIPNVSEIEDALRQFCEAVEADEVMLFEKATFLLISKHADEQRKRLRRASASSQEDIHRLEKISNIVKQFKLSCTNLAASFSSLHVSNSGFSAFIEHLTSNTFIMIVLSDPNVTPAVTLMNIASARKLFERLERPEQPSAAANFAPQANMNMNGGYQSYNR